MVNNSKGTSGRVRTKKIFEFGCDHYDIMGHWREQLSTATGMAIILWQRNVGVESK